MKKLGDKLGLTQLFESLSLLSFKQNKKLCAARLMNYASLLRKKYGYYICHCEHQRYDKIFSELRETYKKMLSKESKRINLKEWITYAEKVL